jgi:type IV pilus assembly protein PilB
MCESCKQVIDVPGPALIDVGFTEEEANTITCYKGEGCSSCGGTGYKGRIALYEVMVVTDQVKQIILQGGTTFEIKAAAMESGMKSLRKSGLQKIKEGMTTVEEILRVTFGD